MDPSDRLRQLVLRSASEHNVLPLTSACNARCVFCSHSLDYAGLDVHRLSPEHTELVREALDYLSPDRKIVIGESATRLIEGEPLTHPQFLEILTRVRQRLPETLIQVTTNGSLLTKRVAAELRALAPLSVSLSLNSHEPQVRRQLMRDAQAEVAVRAPRLLAEQGLPFDVSVVAVPGVVEAAAAFQTIEYAGRHGARRAKVYVAGCSAAMLARNGWDASPARWDALYDDLELGRLECSIPVTFQPPRLRSLAAEVAGVFPGSPANGRRSSAEGAGVRPGDVITRVGSKGIKSRSHAHYLLGRSAPAALELLRGGQRLTVQVTRDADEQSGVVLDEDLSLIRLTALEARLRQAPGPVLVLTSLPAAALVQCAVDQARTAAGVMVVPARSGLFGGTIACAGLLIAEDFVAAGRTACASAAEPFAAVLLPAEPFDEAGLDLVRRSYLEIGERLGTPIALV
jgi:hypothetical protein